MFKRIIYDDWTSIVPHISFWLTFGVFLAITARALFLKKTTVSHMENLPLEDDDNSTQAANK
ncbi:MULTISPECIES: hypothetical protein [unclassified Lentimonas]|uniref:hypothetical protein n=1 Tax=unclassified Lentimonas TaxID=2630993 RepID=UPI0013207C36|nr:MULTISPECIES: hypothetical protein [unclassified Lentimonas]CAA6679118.1 Unannotated [Lentimonas sp. CC4]CAA6684138.1 Unannotated [Lentimonas sp. CC6]CAA6694471.1 Unannotated [Lentimonas sp. CC19]CAA6697104.1 Unannotated [Lentimonas sp. CC10]CAA7069552.1 Unannotated [Lentimonas sp. CC11]